MIGDTIILVLSSNPYVRFGQELIMVQLDLEIQAYDHFNWSFVSGLIHTMGFGPRMSRLIFFLGQDAVSRVMLKGGVTSDISFTRSIRQGCPLSPCY